MNSLKDFRQPFKDFAKNIRILIGDFSLQERLIKDLESLRVQAEQLATQDPITLSLNRRGELWFVPISQVRSVAKIDLYDMRQANRVYGVEAVDRELSRLSLQLQSLLFREQGNYLRRAGGSDEFKIISTTSTVKQLNQLLQKFWLTQQHLALIPWDFGVGETQEEAECYLQDKRKNTRLSIIRNLLPDCHSELLSSTQLSYEVPSYQSFKQPFQGLVSFIEQLKVTVSTKQKLIQETETLKKQVESIIVSDSMTGVLNLIGQKWYVEETEACFQSIAITDMQDMHEKNLYYGTEAVDKDLQRFALVLLKEFKMSNNFLVLRSEKAGDEFQILSRDLNSGELRQRVQNLHLHDHKKGLLFWNYGIGRNHVEARKDLYDNIFTQRSDKSVAAKFRPKDPIKLKLVSTKNAYLILRPIKDEYIKLYNFSLEVSNTFNCQPIQDLHCTVQTIYEIADLNDLIEAIQKYLQNIHAFRVEFETIARVNSQNIDRIWLLVSKTPMICSLYEGLAEVLQKLGLQGYRYPIEHWISHMRLCLLPSNSPPIRDNFSINKIRDLSFQARRLDLTCQLEDKRWQTIQTFIFGSE